MLKKIYIDVDEEITSVIDRLKGAEETDLALVVPKDSALLQSVVNLKLLKREAEKLKKSISLITSNKVGKTLAENVGIKVEGVKNTEPKEVSPLPSVEEKDSVLIEYREEPKEKDEEETISFKNNKIAEDDDDEISIKETEPIEETELKDEESETIEKAETETENPKLTHQKNGKKLKLNGFIVALFLTFIALFIFSYIYIPRATITVKIAAEKKSFETDLTVDKKEPDTKADRGLIAGNFVEISKDFQKKFQSTGKKQIGTKATGTIIVSNKYDSSPQTLVSGTRFQAASGLVFKTTKQVNVPGASVSGGSLQPGSTSVAVEAENPGDNYNIKGTAFSIPGFAGTAKEDLIYGQSSAEMTGGESKEVAIVTESDIVKAKQSFENEAKEELKKELKEKAKDYTLPDEALEISIGSVVSNPQAEGEGSEFTLSTKATAKGLSYKENDIKNAFVAKVKNEAGTNREVVEDGFKDKKLTISKIDLANGSLNINVNSEVYFGTLIDKKAVFTELSGQSTEKSLKYLKGIENVQEAEIKFWPTFFKRIPRLEKHVTIKTEAVQKTEKKEVKSENP